MTVPPAALDALTAVHVDVREDLARGAEPFTRIMQAAQALGATEALVLRAPMEPRPLYEVLGRHGFAHWAEQHGTRDWSGSIGVTTSRVRPPCRPVAARSTSAASRRRCR